MFIYLSKKIAIPNGVKLRCVAWNREQGWIACGGESGLLKVLKLDTQKSADAKTRGVAAPSNLSMNQTLEGHNGAVVVVTWNSMFKKLTTSDQYGLIIVWMLHKGMWFEEMINNRNKSVVRDMQWTSDGQRICIVYEDGAVIVGSVDGNRLWGKEIGTSLSHVCWAPDGRTILFVTLDGEVHLYDNHGEKIQKIALAALDDSSAAVSIVGLDWYDGHQGYETPNAPALAVAFENGRVQVMRKEVDNNPVLIDTGMKLRQCVWNCNGTVLALAGSQVTKLPTGDQRDISQVQFYNPFGQHLRTLKVPGSGIQRLSWEGSGLRIALAVDSFVYFANIRPDYKWGAFSNTVVYSFHKSERVEQCVVFWDTNTDERYVKYVKKLLAIKAAGDNCVLATSADTTGQHILILCNAIGSPVDSKYISINPMYLTMTKTHVIACSDQAVYIWQYRTSLSKLTSVDQGGSVARAAGRESQFHIDVGPDDVSDRSKGSKSMHRNDTNLGTNDAICCVCASDKYLIVGRESGTIHRYTLPRVSLEGKFTLRCRPQQLALNSNSSRMSIIDINGVLTFYDFDVGTADDGSIVGEHLSFERKDAWDMIWAEDNPTLFAVMEKTRMYILRDLELEEPVLSSGYLCSFKDLHIRAVLLDEIMAKPDHTEKDLIVDYETRSLRDARHILAKNGIEDAFSFIESNSHPRLWRLLAETALEKLDFVVADKAFVMCKDYQGIQFVKRLRMLDDKHKQSAEVAVYFQRFDDAEAIYRDIDRKDLAIELRMRLGDWFRVVQLVQSGGGDDELLALAWNKIGDYFADRQKWDKAIQFYTQAKNAEALVECCYVLEDYAGLEKLVRMLPEGAPLLINIGHKFQTVGLTDLAVTALLKANDIKAAIDCCVLLNQWDQAVDLAEQHRFPQIAGLLAKYASHLMETGKIFAAIELYRKANKSTESAKLLAKLAQDVAKTKVNPLRAKKLYVLAALEVERYRKRTLDMGGRATTTAEATQQTLDTLLKQDAETGGGGVGGIAQRTLDNAWHGAEAFHFFLLAQRQLYNGMVDQAMRTALRLTRYEDVLDARDVYSLIALTTFYNKHYGQCSRAFIKLENMDGLTPTERQAYADLALNIFTNYPPSDPASRSITCPNRECGERVPDWTAQCQSCSTNFPGCTVTGRSVVDHRYYKCPECRGRAYEHKLNGLHNCPLCHSPLAF